MNTETTFSSEELTTISSSIATAEKRTSAEILPMVVSSSASESQNSLHVALTVGFQGVIVLGLLWALLLISNPTIFTAVVLSLTALAVGSGFLFLKKLLDKKTKEDVIDRAIREFKNSGITSTLGGTGVLLFISLREKQVVVLADVAIDEVASEGTWEKVVEDTLQGIKSKGLAEGVSAGVSSLGKTLEQLCPLKEGDVNEIKNEIVVKE